MRMKGHYHTLAATIVAWKLSVAGFVISAVIAAAMVSGFDIALAAATETNRGLASQEVGRRALEAKIDKLESGVRTDTKKTQIQGSGAKSNHGGPAKPAR
jgi:hypothetical protein